MAIASTAVTIECFFTLQYYAKWHNIAKYLVAVILEHYLICSQGVDSAAPGVSSGFSRRMRFCQSGK